MKKQPGDEEYEPLTERLAGMLRARGQGRSYKYIGLVYGVQPATIQAYLREARKLLGVTTTEDAIAEAVRLGIINLAVPGWTLPHWMVDPDKEREDP
ncbi:hypothetical protein OG211_12545 [Streptomyces niveus]|uniref:helix-turn-helix transcriptional regulator n=1 Tax=Streptomyces niveus TaxID=193462 RepID=UPI0038667DFD|nr:hypothetical protein OG211_12545 [Streptomyces niveus]